MKGTGVPSLQLEVGDGFLGSESTSARNGPLLCFGNPTDAPSISRHHLPTTLLEVRKGCVASAVWAN